MPYTPYAYHMHHLFVRIASKGEYLPTQDPEGDEAPAGKAPVYLRITLSGARAHVATGVYATLKEWNPDAHRLRGLNAEAKLANAELVEWERRCVDAYAKLKASDPSVRRIKQELVGEEQGAPLTLVQLLEDFVAYRVRSERGYSASTLNVDRVVLSRLRAYLLQIRHKHMLAKEMSLTWLRAYETYCVNKRGHSVAALKKHTGVICLAFAYAAHTGSIGVNPLIGFALESRQRAKPPAYLTLAELEQLRTTPYPRKTMRQTVDAFLFLCYTGLSNVDYLRFNAQENIGVRQVGGRRYEFIRMARQKSGRSFSALLVDQARAILDKYQGQLPRITNENFNNILARARRRAGIEQHITTGLARHTFSQHLRDLGFSDETTSSQAGHSQEVMNLHYSRISEDRIIQEVEKLQPAPTLLEQLRAALQDPSQAALLRGLLSEG